MTNWHTIAEERQRQIEHDDSQDQIVRYCQIMGNALRQRLVRIDPEIFAAATAELFTHALPDLTAEARHRLLQMVGERAGELER